MASNYFLTLHSYVHPKGVTYFVHCLLCMLQTKVYKCGQAGCSKTYSHKNDLTAHMKTAHNLPIRRHALTKTPTNIMVNLGNNQNVDRWMCSLSPPPTSQFSIISNSKLTQSWLLPFCRSFGTALSTLWHWSVDVLGCRRFDKHPNKDGTVFTGFNAWLAIHVHTLLTFTMI